MQLNYSCFEWILERENRLIRSPVVDNIQKPRQGNDRTGAVLLWGSVFELYLQDNSQLKYTEGWNLQIKYPNNIQTIVVLH